MDFIELLRAIFFNNFFLLIYERGKCLITGYLKDKGDFNMSYGMNFGLTMPMMNYTMPFGSGIQSDNWQYSFFAGPGKSSVSYPVDQLSVMNDMALKSYVDNTYNLLPQMMNFMNQMQANLRQWYQKMYEDMQKQMEKAREERMRQQDNVPEEPKDGNIDPTHDDEKVKPEEPAQEEPPVETPPVQQTPPAEDTPPADETEEETPVEEPAETEEPKASEPKGDRSYRGSLKDPSAFDANNEDLAKLLFDAMHGSGTKDKQFTDAMHQLSKDNIVEVMEAYRENYAPQMKEFGFFGSQDYNLIDSVIGDFSGQELKENLSYIGNVLIERAKALTDTVDEEGNVIEDPKVVEFREKLKNCTEVLNLENQDSTRFDFEEFKDWIREIEGTKDKRIIMDTNADTTAA